MRKREVSLGLVLGCLVILGMVAELGDCADPTAAPTKKPMNEIILGKHLIGCKKLTKQGYTVWIVGLAAAVGGLLSYANMDKVKKMLECFMEKSTSKFEDIMQYMGLSVFGDMDWDRNGDETKPLNRFIFDIIWNTIDDTLIALQNHATQPGIRSDGLQLLKYICDKYGPGTKGKQFARRLTIE